MNPNFRLERKLKREGYKNVVGIDEAGRGPLAGPVFAAAVLIKNPKVKILKKVRDSKDLTPLQREKIFKVLIKNKDIEWGIGQASEKTIDKINILEATKLAMVRAVKKLEKKKAGKTDFLVIDGNFRIGSSLKRRQRPIEKADAKILSCSCASILAKVSRDKLMTRLGKRYPKYKFEKHKGYGTKLHFKLLKKYGPCRIHRKSFKPVKD
ncbi:MAG: ribonuclease HII [Patescibacteria group bacterium]